jgi:phage terminase large subunit GpA-like protein
VSEWADAHRRLPKKSSAEPGPWRTERTPYLREIMDCLSTTSDVDEVVFMKAAQIGGTEVILNALGYIIDHAPGPAILVQPTVELAKRFSRQRLDPLFTDTPRLARKVAEGKSRDGGNTMLSKEFAGGQLIVTGANSAVGLRSMPAQYAFLDEIDGYPGDVDEEGSPLELVEARQRTFARRKNIKVSTPTIEGARRSSGLRVDRPAALLRAVSDVRGDAAARVRPPGLDEAAAAAGARRLRVPRLRRRDSQPSEDDDARRPASGAPRRQAPAAAARAAIT